MRKIFWLLIALNIALISFILLNVLGALVTMKFTIDEDSSCTNSMREFVYFHSYLMAGLSIVAFFVNVIGITFMFRKSKNN